MPEKAMHMAGESLARGRVWVPDWSFKSMAILAMDTIIHCTIPGSVLHMEASMGKMLAQGNAWWPHAMRATLANRRREWKAQGRK